MKTRGLALTRAIGSLALVVALVVGVPYLLISLVGNPLPAEMPSIDEMRILLTQNGQGFTNFIIGTLAVLIWLIWAQLMLALVVESSATVRQAETRRLRTAPGIQAFAARLIASITLAATLAAAPVLAPAVGALTFNHVEGVGDQASLVVELSDFADIIPARGEQSATASASSEATTMLREASASMIVSDHTELWDLAEATYGDGVSWKLIALANAGLHDAGGSVITNKTETVAPGTELVLPGAIDAGAVAKFGSIITDGTAVTAQQVDDIHVVEAGDSMWTVAEAEIERRLDRAGSGPEVTDYWVDVVAANQDVSSGDVDLIYPGEELVMPGAGSIAVPRSVEPGDDHVGQSAAAPFAVNDGPVDNRNSIPSRTSTDRAPAADTIPAAAQNPAPISEIEETELSLGEDPLISAPAVGLAAFGAAVFSAGVVGALRRRRDLQRRTRPAGTIARPPSSAAAAFEAAMAHAANEVQESQQGLGWRMMPASAVAALRAAGPLQIHADGSGRLAAVALINTDDAWEPRRLDLDKTIDLADIERVIEQSVDDLTVEEPESGTAVAPTALVVGTDATTGDAVFLDLESAKTVELVGDEQSVRRFARSAVLDLAVSDRADDLCVIAINVGQGLDDLERVHLVNSYSSALTHAVRCGHAAPDSTTPTVIVSADAPVAHDDSAAALQDLGAVIVAPGLDSLVQIRIDGDQAEIRPEGTSVLLAALNDHDYRALAELVETTSNTAVEFVDESTILEELLDVSAATACPVEAGPIEVKVLGPVVVSGAQSFSSLKAVDVVAYLAFHRHGVDADQIKTWVWPAFAPPTDKAFANVMSRARTGLGTADDGSPFLSRAGADKTYRLAEAVTTDFDRFRAIVELADSATETASTLSSLRQALELIRGVPFTGGAASSFSWADNYVRARVEYTIDETVHRSADLALKIGDLATARWAALKGLELVPGCEQCFKRRFLIAGAGNNRTELRRAMADLEASAMADLGEPEAVDTISGELLDLYHELDQALVAGSA